MASRRHRRKIGEKKKKRRKTRAATTTIKKKIVKKSSEPGPQPQAVQPKPSAARIIRAETGGSRTTRNTMMGAASLRRGHATSAELCTMDSNYFCPYNFIHGPFGLGTCKERCPPGRHPLLLDSASGSGSHHLLRRLVRVTNVPLSVIPGEHELRELFRRFGRFGPLARCDLTTARSHDPVGFGWVAFESREQAEAAINKFNGHLVGNRRLRVDWVYPC